MLKRTFIASPLVLTVFCLALVSCASPRQPQFIDEADYTAPIRVACVGDSITYGAGIRDREHSSYPAQMSALLGSHWEVRNFGVSGATLLKQGDRPYWTQQAYRDALAFKPNVVVIKLGTNDSKPHNWAHKEDFVSDYVALIRSFQDLDSKPRIWICRPVPAFPERWGITEQVIANEVIPNIDEVAALTGVPVIDLHAALGGKATLFPDRIHPNAEGAGVIARTIYTALTGRVTANRGSRAPLTTPAGSRLQLAETVSENAAPFFITPGTRG